MCRLGLLGFQRPVVLDVARQISAVDPDQQIWFSLAGTGGIVGQPAAQNERRSGVHGSQGRGNRVVVTQPGVDHDGAGLGLGERGEHVGFEGDAGVQACLVLGVGHPCHRAGPEVVLDAHRALLGRVAAEQHRVADVDAHVGCPPRSG